MKRKLVAILLILCMSVSFSHVAHASSCSLDSEDELKKRRDIDDILFPDEDTMFNQMLKQLPYDEQYLLSNGIIDSNSLERKIYVETKTPLGVKRIAQSTYYYSTLDMPSANFYIVTECWKNKDYTTTTYNGETCFKFTKNGIVIYVKKTAFYPTENSSYYDKSGQNPSNGVVSSIVSNYLNDNNTSMYYTALWRIFNADGLQYVQLSMYGTQAFKYEEDEIVLQHRVVTCSDSSALIRMNAPKYPTLKVTIANTGAGNRYLGGYYIKGVGSSTSTKDISKLINLGYKTYKLASGIAVSNLSFNDVYSLYNVVVGLNKSGSTYLSDTIPLSNPGKNIYSYSCGLKSPFALENTSHYYQIHVGLNGADGTSLKYKVTLTTSSSK